MRISDWSSDVCSSDLLRHAKLFGHGALGGIDVDANNPVCASQPGTLNDVEADAAQAEDNDIRPRFHPRGPDDRAYAGRHATTAIRPYRRARPPGSSQRRFWAAQ